MVGEARGARGRAAPAAACRRMGCGRVDGADDGVGGAERVYLVGFLPKKRRVYLVAHTSSNYEDFISV